MTTESKALEALKSAILLERKGKALYSRAAEHTQSQAARELFQFLAAEEDDHVAYLSRLFQDFTRTGKFSQQNPAPDRKIATDILTKRISQEIAAADYEAAVIMAAIGMEEQAIKSYGARAAATSDGEERRVYEELVRFEREHLAMLIGMNQEITQSVWFDNQFWPY